MMNKKKTESTITDDQLVQMDVDNGVEENIYEHTRV